MVLDELTSAVESNGTRVQMSRSEWNVAEVISKAISEAETQGFSLRK